jgi:oxygen-independent coproporphyrinogen-3 oxidase
MSASRPISVVRLAAPTRGPVPLAQLPPLSLYIHLPWCLRKCPYCDFNSHEWRGGENEAADLPERAYLDALQADLEAALPLVWGRSVQTVFIGGGTPSLFSPASIDALLAMVRARVRLAAGAEITLEANPGTFEAGRFADFARAGVTRLSIGVQSFDDRLLQAIGRVHDGDQARAAVAEAARHFASFNLDLMYALPGQTLADLAADLDTALGFRPPHLSAYHLTLEPNTLFARHPPPLPDDDLAADMQSLLQARLAADGLARYEVSAFARDGHRCRHNLNYWEFGDYLGIGAGAHGKISSASGVIRQARLRHPQRYQEAALAGRAVEIERVLEAADLPFEFMLNALRLVEGVPATLFGERTGLSATVLAAPLGVPWQPA